MSEMIPPLKLFYWYAEADKQWRDALDHHLSALKHRNILTILNDQKLDPGDEQKQRHLHHLNKADVILLLISSDFLNSKNFPEDWEYALEKRKQEGTLVIPIKLRPVYLPDDFFNNLQSLPRNGSAILSSESIDEAFTQVAKEISNVIDERQLTKKVLLQDDKQTSHEFADERRSNPQTIPSSSNSFISSLLKNFVGREQELVDLREHIKKLQQHGGCIAITGESGQGKSTIIAKLIEEYKDQDVVYHFIPFNSGSDYQVELLKHLMTQLIQKHRLPEFYIVNESLPVLYDYFLKMLQDIAERDEQEVIFIDGWEQIEEEQNKTCQSSFSSINPPEGIVFVLGSNVESIFKFFDSSTTRVHYPLEKLSLSDFSIIVEHRDIHLEQKLVKQLYNAAEGNALYLYQAVRELEMRETGAVDEILASLTPHPENFFSLTTARLEKLATWNKMLKSILGVLTVACGPLSIQSLCQILNIEEDHLQNGIKQLDWLITADWQDRYSLFHQKFYEYLHGNKHFSFQRWHKQLAEWCGNDQLSIWSDTVDLMEQQRRSYARKHYITHLYHAQDWSHLFYVLKLEQYGQAKLAYFGLGGKSYILDLNLGSKAAIQKDKEQMKQIKLLPRLWYYTLLRCSLTNRKHWYPREAFQLLVLLKREQEALYIAESLVDAKSRAEALLSIAKQMQDLSGSSSMYLNTIERVAMIIVTIKEKYEQVEILIALGRALVHAQQIKQACLKWAEAEQIIDELQDTGQQAKLLLGLGRAFISIEHFIEAQRLIDTIEDNKELQALGLIELGLALAQKQELEQAKIIWNKSEQVINSISNNEQQMRLLYDLGIKRLQARQWTEAEHVITAIHDPKQQTEALRELGRALAQAGQWEWATTIWMTEQLILTPQHVVKRVQVLCEIGQAFARAQQWERASSVWVEAERLTKTIQASEQKIRASLELGKALAQTCWSKIEQQENKTLHREQKTENLGTPEYERPQQQNQQEESSQTSHGTKHTSNAGEVNIEEKFKRHWQIRFDDISSKLEQIIKAIQDPEQQYEMVCQLVNILVQAQQWDYAEKTPLIIQDDVRQIKAFLELSQVLAQKGKRELTRKVAISTKGKIQNFQDKVQRNTALEELAQVLIKQHYWPEARIVIEDFQNTTQRDIALIELSQELIKEREWSEAEIVIKALQDITKMNIALEELVCLLIENHQLKEAEQLIKGIEEKAKKLQNELRCKLAKGFMQMSNWIEIERMIGTIEDNERKTELRYELAKKFMQISDWIEAERVIESITDTKQCLEAFSKLALEAFSKLAQALALVHEWEQAITIWMKAKQLITTPQHIVQRVMVLSELGRAFTRAEQWERAESVWIEAQRLTNALQDSEQKTEALLELGKATAQARKWELAEWARSLIPLEDQTGFLIELGRSYILAEKGGEALSIIENLRGTKQYIRIALELAKPFLLAERWEDVEWIINTIPNENHDKEQDGWENNELYDTTMKEKIRILIQAQHWETAKQLIDEIQNSQQPVELLCDLGLALAQTQHLEDARVIWGKLKRAMDTTQDNEQWAETLYTLWQTLAQAQQWKLAEEVINIIQDKTVKARALQELQTMLIQAGQWDVSEQRTHNIDDREQKGEAFYSLVKALVEAQQWEEIKKVISSITDKAQGSTIVSPILPIEKPYILFESVRPLIESQQWQKAEEVIITIKDTELRDKSLSNLIVSLGQAQEWQKAEHLINIIETPNWQVDALIQLQEWQKAEHLIITIKDTKLRDELLSNLIVSLGQAQEWQKAEHLIITIKDTELRDELLSNLIVSLGQAQEWQKAEHLIITIKDTELRDRVLAQIQQWQKAEQSNNTIKRPERPNRYLVNDTLPVAKKQRQDNFRHNIQEIKNDQFLDTIFSENNEQKNVLLNELGTYLTKAGRYDELLDLVQRVWLRVETREDAIALLPLAFSFISIQPTIGPEFCEAFNQVNHFLNGQI